MRYFREELNGIYEVGELETMMAYCFEDFVNIKRAELSIRLNDTVSESDLLKFNFAVKDLKKFKPIQYILGNTYFYGIKLKVNAAVLIPRPETEELVDWILHDLKESPTSASMRLLDLGTGSGCIPIVLKKNMPSLDVSAMDVSDLALNLAHENARMNGAEIHFWQDDILNPHPPLWSSRYDVMVSNPPYVCMSEKNEMLANVLDYEPHLALFVPDNDPLLYYKAIADLALRNLNKGGKVYFELNQNYGLETKSMMEEKGFKNVIIKKDLNNKNRILRGEINE